MAIGLKKYLSAENPHIWLFNGKEADGRYSVKGLLWVMRESLKQPFSLQANDCRKLL
jgi:hypothetical protein